MLTHQQYRSATLRRSPSSAGTSTARCTAWPAQRIPLARRRTGLIPCAAANSSSRDLFSEAGQAFSTQAQAFAESMQKGVSEFVAQQKLEEKAARASKEAQKAVSNTVQEVQEGARRTYMKLDSEYNLRGKADAATRRAREAAADIDQQWGVRRRLRAFAADVAQRLPLWRRRAAQFSATQEGKAAGVVVFVVLLSTGALWQVLNLVWLLWWVSLPVGFLMADRARKEATEAAEAAQQQQQQQQQQRRQQYGAFASFFEGAEAGSGRSSGRSSSRSSRSSGYWEQEGPVVDAQWVSLDDDGSYKRR